MVSSGTRSSCRLSSWRIGATTRRLSTTQAWRGTMRRENRSRATSSPSSARRRRIRRVWACSGSSSLARSTCSSTPRMTRPPPATRPSLCSTAWPPTSPPCPRCPRIASCAASLTSSPAATRPAITHTSGPRSCRPTRSPLSKRRGSTTRRRCRWSGEGSERPCCRWAAPPTPPRSSAPSAAATRHPNRSSATRGSPERRVAPIGRGSMAQPTREVPTPAGRQQRGDRALRPRGARGAVCLACEGKGRGSSGANQDQRD
mmetsp:Transcript_7632/g.25073  ORF Transcript_7632/g.25073 Transcript_7632/m.25073 type:complete len:259 (-) Transcript_7632:296-1072(-)